MEAKDRSPAQLRAAWRANLSATPKCEETLFSLIKNIPRLPKPKLSNTHGALSTVRYWLPCSTAVGPKHIPVCRLNTEEEVTSPLQHEETAICQRAAPVDRLRLDDVSFLIGRTYLLQDDMFKVMLAKHSPLLYHLLALSLFKSIFIYDIHCIVNEACSEQSDMQRPIM